jgi:hypothetical protein
MSGETYLNCAISEVEACLTLVSKIIPTKCATQHYNSCCPDLDQGGDLYGKRMIYIQGLIFFLLIRRCELGHTDIIVDASLLSRYLGVNPRKGIPSI